MSAGKNKAVEAPLTFKVAGPIGQYLFGQLTRTTDTVALGAGAPEVITVQPSDTNDIIACASVKDVSGAYYVYAAVDITLGDEVTSDAAGKAVLVAQAGDTKIYAKKTVKAGGLVPVYSF